MRTEATSDKRGHGAAYFEQISIPPGDSFLWRIDDYPWKRCVWNYHPEFEIHLIRHSAGLSYVGDYIGTFNAGQLVMVGSNLPHNWITPLVGDTKLVARDIVVQFDPEKFMGSVAHLAEFSEITDLFRRAAFGIEFLAEAAAAGADILEKMGRTNGLSRLAHLIELLAIMANSTNYRTLATKDFIASFEPGSLVELEILKQALDYIQRRFRDNPSLAEAAKLVGMSESALSRFLKTHTGNNFSDHVATLRMWTARKLLSEHNIPITDICYQVGFRNVSNFNRAFLADSGMTPSKYRRAANGRSISGIR